MNRGVGSHGVEKGDVVRAGGDIWKEIGDPLPGLTVLFEFPLRTNNAPLVLLSTATKRLHIDGLPVQRIQGRFIVKRVHVAGTAVHEEEDHALGLARKRWILRNEGVGVGSCLSIAKKAVLAEQAS